MTLFFFPPTSESRPDQSSNFQRASYAERNSANNFSPVFKKMTRLDTGLIVITMFEATL